MHPSRSRSPRGAVVVAFAVAAIATGTGSALAATEIPPTTGTPGGWSLPDSAADPAAACSYEGGGTAGAVYLTGIDLFEGPEITGLHPGLRSVGYRPIVQHKRNGVWTTVKKGVLVTGQATSANAADLPGELTAVPVVSDPNRFRLLLRLFWYRADATVEASTTVRVDSYVKYEDAGVGSSCKGKIRTVG